MKPLYKRMPMFSIPNLLSLSRIPLAFIFLSDNPLYRTIALLLALLSDILDGYIARKYNLSSKLGTIIDPITDKFFVLFALVMFFMEQRLSFGEAAAMLSRDFAVFLFGCYLALRGHLAIFQVRAIWSGKISTFLQIAILLGITWQIAIPFYLFVSCIVLGCLALVELSRAEYIPN